MMTLTHQQDESLRTELEEKRLAWQAAKSDFLHYTEQLKELNSKPDVSDDSACIFNAKWNTKCKRNTKCQI